MIESNANNMILHLFKIIHESKIKFTRKMWSKANGNFGFNETRIDIFIFVN